MTKEQIKNVLPLIQAFAEGKIIQYRDPSLGIKEWSDLEYSVGVPVNNLLEEPNNYRVKPEPPYRPFRNAEECWQEMLKHAPFGIMSSKNGKDYMSFMSLNDEGCDFWATKAKTSSLHSMTFNSPTAHPSALRRIRYVCKKSCTIALYNAE